MAFTFDEKDIQMAIKTLNFGGEYNVTIQEAEFKGQTKNGLDYFTVRFEVLDSTEKGATVSHTFMDDSSSKKAFRYREINALFNALGGLKPGTEIELENVANFLPGRNLAVEVGKWEKSVSSKGNVVYYPRVTNFGPVMKSGSVINKDLPNPNDASQPAAPVINNADPFDTPTVTPGDADAPFVDSNDPFA